MPRVFEELFADTGAPLDVELVRVEPVTRYRFADGSSVELSADLPRAVEALEAWSPGAGADWARFMRTCAAMWRASVPFLTGPPPWPPRMPVAGRARRRTRATSCACARGTRCARSRARTRATRGCGWSSSASRRTPAPTRGARRPRSPSRAGSSTRSGRGTCAAGSTGSSRRSSGACGRSARRCATSTRGRRAAARRAGASRGVSTAEGHVAADAVVWGGDALVLDRLLGRPTQPERERSLSGFALMLGLRGKTEGLVHHAITFPADYDAEFDDVFVARRLVRDPTLYVSASCATDRVAGAGRRARTGSCSSTRRRARRDESEADAYEEQLVERLGVGLAGRRRARGARRWTSSARRARSAARSTAPRRTGGSGRCAGPGRSCAACAGCIAWAARRIPAAGCRSSRSAGASSPTRSGRA